MNIKDALQVIAYAANELATKSEQLATTTPQDLIRHYADVRSTYDALQGVKKLINEVDDRLSRTLIPDIMRENKIKNITIEGVGRVVVSHRYSCTMVDKPRGIDWLRQNGAASMVQETVNSASLAAYSKNMLENQGRELPPDIFKTSMSPYTSITKVK